MGAWRQAADPVELEKVIDYLDLDMFITYNGQFVYTKQNLIYAKPFSKNILEEIVAYADEKLSAGNVWRRNQSGWQLDDSFESITSDATLFAIFVPKKFPLGA